MSKIKTEAQNPLILRCHRLMEAFAKANDERDFYLDRTEGFLVYIDLDKSEEELNILFKEIETNQERYFQIPKFTFYETKKIMEGFVNEKVYDIDTKEKLLDIIQSKEARENFLEFLYDHHSEFEKWQQYYQERSRVRIIEWLRNNNFHFVFEEDIDLAKNLVEKLKLNLFEVKAHKDILAARKGLFAKAKTYYSNEALNPRPKRGRPPKQAVKQEIDPQFTGDFYVSVSPSLRSFLFTPDHNSGSAAFTFSSKFENEEALLASRKQQQTEKTVGLEDFQNRLASLRSLTTQFAKKENPNMKNPPRLEIEELEEEEEEEEEEFIKPKQKSKSPPVKQTIPSKKPVATIPSKPSKKMEPVKKTASKPAPVKKPAPKQAFTKLPPPKKAAVKLPPPKPAKAKAKTPPAKKLPPPPAAKGRPKGSSKTKRIIRK